MNVVSVLAASGSRRRRRLGGGDVEPRRVVRSNPPRWPAAPPAHTAPPPARRRSPRPPCRLVRRHHLGGPGGVRLDHRLRPQLADDAAHLAERHGMASGPGLHVRRSRGAGHAQQAVLHPLEMLAHDVQAAAGQHRVDVRHPAGQAVLAREHGQFGRTGAHRVDRLPRTCRTAAWAGRAGRRGRRGPSKPRGGLGTRRSCQQRPGAFEVGRGVDAERAVIGTRVQAIRIPASSARSCSRPLPPLQRAFGGSATNRARASRRKA